MDRSLVHRECGVCRWGVIAVLSSVACALAGVLLWWYLHGQASACEKEVRFGDLQRGIQTCLESYQQSKDPRDLVWAAKGYMQVGELGEADALAQQLLTGPLVGDTHAILSYLALRRGAGSEARIHATIAFVAHTLDGDERGRASDAMSLAKVAWQLGDFTASLAAADEALRLSRRLGEPALEVAAQLARVDPLRRMGDARGAEDAAARAREQATAPCDQMWAHFKSGMCRMEAQQAGLALSEFDAATQANLRCGSRDLPKSIALDEAWLLHEKEPAAALARLNEVTKSDGDSVDTLLLRGHLAAERGALGEADGYITQAERLEPPDADWPWEIARLRAELTEMQGGPSGDEAAEPYYRRAIEMITALRTTSRARSAYFVASHRAPYDELIALLARHGRWRDVLGVVLELDASDMLRATAGEVRPDHASPDVVAPPPSSATVPPASVDDVLSAWRGRDLVIVIAPSQRQIGAGHERAYRLRIRDGHVTGEDVGDANQARTWAVALFADPGNRDAARALGRMIVPPDPTSGTLHVLAIGALGKAPLAALRDDDGAPSIARRPLVRVLGLRANGPESRGTGPAVIIADARGDLPSAAVEGSVVAKALGSGALVSGSSTSFPATQDRLWAASDAALLHIAGHVGELGRWRALRLADGEVGPSEMVRRRLAPRLAVLAGCGSAAALDEEGWGSIAAALLESGTAVVIATDRSVDDDASLTVMRGFYAQPDWSTDPARALARVQQALAAQADASGASSEEVSKPQSWAAFSVLGRPPVVPVR